jgi:multimeric flavodoxin WrbA
MADRRMVRVLGVMGSPRLGGNTDVLLAETLRGAASVGAATTKVDLVTRDVRPCSGCDGCTKSGVCVIDDDMGELLDELLASDVWVLGTPVYWWGPTAQMKAFIDRWYAGWQTADGRARMAKRVALISPFGDSEPATARHVVGMLADALEFLKADFAGQLLVSADKRGEVAANVQAMAEAFALGARLGVPAAD